MAFMRAVAQYRWAFGFFSDLSNPFGSISHQRQTLQGGHLWVRGVVGEAAEVVQSPHRVTRPHSYSP
jgi:hypothetical protein